MSTHTRDSELMVAGRMLERRRNGDMRPLLELASELLEDISDRAAKRSLVQHVVDRYLRLARKDALGGPDQEVELELPFVTGPIGRYRTQPLVRVRREGREDYIKASVARGTEINQHDSWELAQRRRSVAHTQKRKNDNLAHSKELIAIGLDPTTQSNHDMHKHGDIRTCVLCGEGPFAGDPWEREHETPVVVGEGAGRIGWAHQSCNRSKGKTEVDHLPTHP